MCVQTFWYFSVLLPFFGFGEAVISLPAAKLSFATSWSGFEVAIFFFGAGAFFCFLFEGGVFDKTLSSCTEPISSISEFSSSESGFARFFGAAFVGLRVVWVVFFGAAFTLGAAGFFGGALAF